MKRILLTLLTLIITIAALTGCEKKEEEKSIETETYVEENEVQVVHHDTENVDFRIAVITGDMKTGFERLIGDAKKEEAANHYRFYEYRDFNMFKSVFDCGSVDITTLPLEEALEVYRENPEFICLLSINAELENGYGVTAATQKFAKTYPFALQVFIEEMKYSAKEATCIDGDEMRALIEAYLTEQEEELPGDEFYYPLPEETDEGVEVIDVEEPEEND